MKTTISNYEIIDTLYESSNSMVYRAVQKQDNTSVILKVLQSQSPTSEEQSRFISEYETTKTLQAPGIVRLLRLEEDNESLRMVQEDIGAESLDRRIKRHRMTLEECLFVGARIAESIATIHAEDIIHKNICVSNVIWNEEKGLVQIIDFGIASRLLSEAFTLKPPDQLEGTLAYVSPEQTGRINRSIDYRTDLYSLGVTLYEMLTGKLPFRTTDTIELVHCHIAKIPTPPCEVNTDIPPIVSDIIMKLLEKNAEDRYQSALGVKSDLEICQEHLSNQQNTTVFKFELGKSDFSSQFLITQKLYGRESEISTLLETFGRVSSGEAEVIIVAGYSGIGKTALVHEICRPMTEKRGYFLSGKFDQFKQDIPYYAITQAFNGFFLCLCLRKARSLYKTGKTIFYLR